MLDCVLAHQHTNTRNFYLPRVARVNPVQDEVSNTYMVRHCSLQIECDLLQVMGTEKEALLNLASCRCVLPGGHYTSHVLQPDGQWLHFNDAHVSVVSQHHVLSERTYLLVYQKLT